ncbi:hypothetical protein ACO0QE_000413 [Hanseniaspora vineae]
MKLNVAVHGCVHGDLKKVYDLILSKSKDQKKVDLLIILGDVQTLRSAQDLVSISIPPKYLYNNNVGKITDFPRFIKDQYKIPIPTIIIGGNHENMKQFAELPHGGYIYPDLYYMGLKSVVSFKGLKIAGFSGITNLYDVYKPLPVVPHFSETSANSNTSGLNRLNQWWNKNKKTLYHVRFMELVPLYLYGVYSDLPLDMVLSHDWPAVATRHGNVEDLLKRKPYFGKEISKGELGSKLYDPLLQVMRPKHWLSSHLHVKWGCEIPNTFANVEKNKDEIDLFDEEEEEEESLSSDVSSVTKFLALDKFLPSRPGQSFDYLEVEVPEQTTDSFEYDPVFINILRFVDTHKTEIQRLVSSASSFDDNFARVKEFFGGHAETKALGMKDAVDYSVIAFEKELSKQSTEFLSRFLLSEQSTA